jgi:Fur family transcriptional regulator, ferric uptake regulator
MQDALQVLRDHLRKKGLKDTSQREEVLGYLSQADRHLAPEELFEALRKKDPKIGRATVFRTLKLLEECGLVSKVTFPDGHARYERAHGRHHHDHMICVDCQDVIEFESDEIEALQNLVVKRHGFHLLWHRHELFGRCRRCAAKASS